MKINKSDFLPYSILLFIFLIIPVINLNGQREAKTINDGWHFKKGDMPEVNEAGFKNENWEKIQIPHSWNSDAYITKEYYRGICWYQKNIFLPETYKDKQLFIRFEGVNQVASVYINGQFAGEHKGGYTSFTFDITPYCKTGKENIITVKADNTLTEKVSPISGDFTVFGGIYRDVWLIATNKQHLDLSNYGSDGVFVETTGVSAGSASILIRGKVINETSVNTNIKLTHHIINPKGDKVIAFEENMILSPGEKKDFRQNKTINSPELWSPETPALYTVETIIQEEKTGKVLDNLKSNIGFRWYSFDGEKGFFLNGKPYKLNGVCRHQDQKPFANALSDEMHRRDMQMIKDMGANFIRISHYPQDPAIIEQCDKLGLLAWEEIPVIDIVPAPVEFGDNCETVLREMIRQHYNHPSIIMWGYMNEILLVTQRKFKGKELDTVVKRSLELARRLEKVVKEEDPHRKSVMAFHGSESYNELGFGDITDIVGWNLYQGWYSDNLAHFDAFMEKQQKLFPDKPKIVSEYGAGSDKRIHGIKTKRFDFSMEYQQDYIEHYLAEIERKPYIVGSTYWNFIDFGSAQRDESMPRINNKGIVYADRTPKDVYYLFKSYFRKDIPVLHIASTDWKNRVGVRMGDVPVLQPIKVYSNLPEAELFMNGNSMGKKNISDNKAVWDIPFVDGSHYFTVKSSFEGKAIETGLEISFSSVPDKFNAGNIEGIELAINAGSDVNYTSPESGLTWLADKEYTPGGWGYIGGESYSTQTEIKGTNDNPLFQTLRIMPEKYKFDVPDGDYEIELLFADVFRSGTTIAHNLGSENTNENINNVFDVAINGTVADPLLEPVKATGAYFASKKKYIINTGNKKTIEIVLIPHTGKTFLNGIKLRKL